MESGHWQKEDNPILNGTLTELIKRMPVEKRQETQDLINELHLVWREEQHAKSFKKHK